ncbi:MAG: hypothetical protein ACD_80C00113G0006 [uncultured bacterium (gcode 4)]|uniref:Uncharacterized protein n=1 Tax=uncultured bacterium (gcode 4) TaxID=1234023 RepID=K1XXV8_9BACT|nr:MAG: hypothetical protein ACD_80C00113G0006 [uncultured bacterium (gcode 4)]HBB04253.1 hypothetical protein [Candidatus Gracilibacteria bacterium]
MDKFIFITTVNSKIPGKPVQTFCAPIHCKSSQEKAITDLIESKKIDLGTLIGVMLPDTEENMREEAQAFLDSFQEIIKECSIIIVAFLNAAQMRKIKGLSRKNDMLKDMSKSQDIISKN